jgi:hypothetical protein
MTPTVMLLLAAVMVNVQVFVPEAVEGLGLMVVQLDDHPPKVPALLEARNGWVAVRVTVLPTG